MRRARPPYTLRTLSVRAVLCTLALLLVSVLPPAPLHPAHAATGQIFMWSILWDSVWPNASGIYRAPMNGLDVWNATENLVKAVAGGPVGTVWHLKKWYLNFYQAAGAGNSITITFRKNGVDTAAVQSIAGASQTTSTWTGDVTFGPTDILTLRWDQTGSPGATTAPNANVSCVYGFQSDAPNKWLWINNSATTQSITANATQYMQSIFTSTTEPAAFEGDAQAPVPMDLTISDLVVDLDTAPGTSQTCTLRKNGVDTAVTVTINNPSNQGSDHTHSASFVAGDLLSWKLVNVGAGTGKLREGCMCAPTNGNLCCSMMTGNLQTQNTSSYWWESVGNDTSAANRKIPVYACTVKNLYIDAANRPPAAGQSTTSTVNVNLSDTAITAQCVGGTNTVASDTTHSATMADFDTVSIHGVTSATSGTCEARYGIAFDIPQGGSAGDPSALLLRGVGRRPVPLFAPGRAN